MMLDATKSAQQRPLLEKELEDVGVRLNQKRPDVILKRKSAGGIVVTKAMGLTLTKIDEKMIRSILQGYKIHVRMHSGEAGLTCRTATSWSARTSPWTSSSTLCWATASTCRVSMCITKVSVLRLTHSLTGSRRHQHGGDEPPRTRAAQCGDQL